MKCRKCGKGAALELRRHNAAFCAPDFLEFFRNQVREAIRRHRMFTREESVLVAVSGGKDSLALWDVLIDDGYRTTGLYLDLGIFDYSRESKAKCEAFAARRVRLQAAVGRQIHARKTPVLQFRPDEVIRQAERIEQILREERRVAPPPDPDGSDAGPA